MLTPEQNKLLTDIEPGSRMGELLRRYWHPIAGRDDLKDRWTMPIRLFGEDLLLFRDRTGKLGLIGESCPHRRASLANGIPTSEGIRCPYHGWMFNQEGVCIDQPFETGKNALRGAKAVPAYPVEELGGMIFAYMGPLPAPQLPKLSPFFMQGAIRAVGKYVIPCNWLQCMENSADPVHTEWLHGALAEFVREADGRKTTAFRSHAKIDFVENEFGFVKRRLYVGQSEDAQDWTVGHPVIFPNMLCTGNNGAGWQQRSMQIRVPIDNENTLHLWYTVLVAPEGITTPQHLLDEVPVYEPKIKNADGTYNLDITDGQDIMAWVTQGKIADRSKEFLGASDKGIVMYRRMLRRELDKVELGEDPLGVQRSPDAPVFELQVERGKQIHGDGFRRLMTRNAFAFSPHFEEVVELFTQAIPNAGGPLEAVA
jgi:5,5'-dehydrodivanillate O-demethylase